MVLSVEDAAFSLEHAQKTLDAFGHQDDVFSDDFKSVAILQCSQDVALSTVAARLAESRHFQAVYTNAPGDTHDRLPQGPYFIQGQSIHQAWKLYEDDLDAFVVPTIADDPANPSR